MEYQTDNNNELETMRMQLQTLKQKLESQKIVTDNLTRHAMRDKMSWIKRYTWMQLFLIWPFIIISFFGMAYIGEISWALFWFTVITTGISVVADIFINRVSERDWLGESLLQTCHKLIRMKRMRVRQQMVGIPLGLILILWMAFNIAHGSIDPEAVPLFIISICIGGTAGGIIGLLIVRKMQRTNDAIIRQIRNFYADINEQTKQTLKKIKKIMMIALLMVVAITGAKAQLLYKISGKDLKQPSYIVGTYHLAPVSFVDSIPGLRAAMTETQQVCGELDMSDMMSPDNIQKMMKAMMLPEGKTLKDYLTVEEMDKLNQLMKSLIGMDLTNPILEQQMGKMTPSAINTQLAVLMYMKHTPGFDPTNLFDGYFQKAAKEANKPVVGLETMDFQIKTLYQGKSLERQKTMLMCMVNNTAYHEQNLIALTRAFFAKDLAKMWEITKEKENNSCDSTPEEDAQLIDNRNIDWLTKLPAIMADKSTLIAVGAGHLPGDKGVLSLLRQAGYTVEAVK